MAGWRTFTFLGTGTSVGVPMLGCDCAVCRSTNPRNSRYRCAALIRTAAGNLLIDTPPELRLQLLRDRVALVHAVLFTHYHVDHLFGLDDVRLFPRLLGHPLPIYCAADVEAVIRQAFSYVFAAESERLPTGAVPKLTFRRIDREPFEVLGELVRPIPLIHSRFAVNGYRIGDMAYCTDLSEVPDASWPLLEGLDVLILDCLRFKPHPAHLSLDQALAVIERARPRRAYLTHLSHEFEYEALSATLPDRVALAYDTLCFPF